MEVFEQILYVDQLSYAVQWVTGPTSTPTPIVRLLCSSITVQSFDLFYYRSHNSVSLQFYSKHVAHLGEYLHAWIDLLCARRAPTWNSDQVSLQVLGTIVRIAFLRDAVDLMGLREKMTVIYTVSDKLKRQF